MVVKHEKIKCFFTKMGITSIVLLILEDFMEKIIIAKLAWSPIITEITTVQPPVLSVEVRSAHKHQMVL